MACVRTGLQIRNSSAIRQRCFMWFFRSIRRPCCSQSRRLSADDWQSDSVFKEYREVNLFLRGIGPLIGFKLSVVRYKPRPRFGRTIKIPYMQNTSFVGVGRCDVDVDCSVAFCDGDGGDCFFAFNPVKSFCCWCSLVYESSAAWLALTVLPIYLLGGVRNIVHWYYWGVSR